MLVRHVTLVEETWFNKVDYGFNDVPLLDSLQAKRTLRLQHCNQSLFDVYDNLSVMFLGLTGCDSRHYLQNIVSHEYDWSTPKALPQYSPDSCRIWNSLHSDDCLQFNWNHTRRQLGSR